MASMEKEFKVVKKADEEFEFFLKMNSERKQIITKVTPGGPADRAGCKDGDILTEVNGQDISNSTHDETVDIIRKSIPENKVTFKVKRPAAAAAEKPAHTKKSSNSSNNNVSTDMRPRICKLVKKDGSFGFNLKGFVAREKQAHIVEKIREGGAAEEAGLLEDDRIIKVNKTNVEKLTHQQLVTILKKSGNKVTMLVVDGATYHRYKTQKKKISEKDVTSSRSNGAVRTAKTSRKTDSPLDGIAMDESTVSAPRQLHIVPSKQGMGFFLRSKKEIAEEFAGGVEKDGAGYICGLREHDRIIAVNGTSVHNKTHEEIIALLKENKHHVVLIVLSPKSLSVIESKGIGSLGETEVSKLEKPRTIKMSKGSDGYGFYLKMIKGEQELPHHILTDIEDGSAAEKAGLKNEEILASVNGTNIMHKTHQACVEAIRDSGDHVTLIVGSRETMNIFYNLKIDITQDFLDDWPKEEAFHQPTIGDFVKKRLASIRQPHVADSQELIPRLCHLTKDQHSYSFYLRDDDGSHLLEQVEEGGAAHKAGVREGDVIIEVNGVSVLNETHDEVVNRIRERKDSVTFLVADEATRNHFSVKGVVITAKLLEAAKENVEEQQAVVEKPKNLLKPRLCHLVKDRTFGFHLNSEQNVERPGQYIRQVAEGGVADVAGVKEGDRIIEINGENIESKTHKEVVGMIVKSGTEVTFLVVDEEADLHFKKLGVMITLKLLNDDADDKRSVTSSIHSVQAEATVHDEPVNKPEIVIDHVEESPRDRDNDDDDLTAIQSIEAAIDDVILEDRKEELVDSGWDGEVRKEIREEKEEVIENGWDGEISKEVREDDDGWNNKEEANGDGWNKGDEIREEIREEIVEEIVEEAREEIIEDVKEEIVEDVKEEIVEELKEDIREEIVEEVKEDIREEVVAEVKEEIREEIREDIREEVVDEIQDAVEEAREERVEDIREEIREEIKEDIKEEIREEFREEVREESEEEMKRRIREEMKREAQEEMMARIREEVKREMLAEAAAQVAVASVSPIKIPDPPSTPPTPVVREKADSIRSVRSTTSSTTSSQRAEQKAAINFAEINNVRLRPVKERMSKKAPEPKVERQPEPEPEPEAPKPALAVQNSIRARMAMFEQNKKAAAAAAARPKVSVVAAAAAPKPSPSQPVTSPRSSKPFTFKSASQMSFKIVETTPVIN